MEVDVQAATSVIENNVDKQPNMSKDELIKIVSPQYEVLKEFDHDIIFKIKE